MLKLAYLAALVASSVCFAFIRLVIRRRAAKQELLDTCLACGSSRVSVEGSARVCEECGYSGRADGGGKLSAQELHVMGERSDSW